MSTNAGSSGSASIASKNLRGNGMALTKDTAIVLRRLDYSETSQVLAVMTREHGQQRLIAKGIKRSTKTRVAVGVDLLERGSVIYSRRSGKEDVLGTLTDWRQQETFAHLRRDLACWHAAQYAGEVTAQLTEVNDPHPDLFDSLDRALARFDTRPTLPVLCGFLWTMLRQIGLRPELGRCVGCTRPLGLESELFFSARAGGAICRDCEPATIEKRRVNPAAARCLVHSESDRGGSWEDDPAVAQSAFDLLDYHITETLSRPPRLSAPLKQALKMARPKSRGGPSTA